jgi:hypothetical protein
MATKSIESFGNLVVDPDTSRMLIVDDLNGPIHGTSTVKAAMQTVLAAGLPDIVAGDPGTEASGINVDGTTYDSELKVSDITDTNLALFIVHRHSLSLPAIHLFARSHSADETHGIVQNGDVLGANYYVGWDGNNYKIAAVEQAVVDGTPGANDMPGAFEWWTTPNGSKTPLRRMRLRENGALEFDNGYMNADQVTYDNATSGLTAADVQAAIDEIVAGLGTAAAQDYEEGTWTPTFAFTTPGDLSPAYATQLGSYVKIGDVVFYSFQLTVTPTWSTSSGQVRIGGWPFGAGAAPNANALRYRNVALNAATVEVLITIRTDAKAEVNAQRDGNSDLVWTTAQFPSGTQFILIGAGLYTV